MKSLLKSRDLLQEYKVREYYVKIYKIKYIKDNKIMYEYNIDDGKDFASTRKLDLSENYISKLIERSEMLRDKYGNFCGSIDNEK